MPGRASIRPDLDAESAVTGQSAIDRRYPNATERTLVPPCVPSGPHPLDACDDPPTEQRGGGACAPPPLRLRRRDTVYPWRKNAPSGVT